MGQSSTLLQRNPMKTLNTWEEVQSLIEQYGLPFASSLNEVIVGILNQAVSRNVPQYRIQVNPEIVSKGYAKNPWLWADVLARTCEYPIVQGYRSRLYNGNIIIRGGGQKIKPAFLPTLVAQLLKGEGRVVCRSANIPNSYKYQPYNIICKLRRHGIEAEILHIDEDQIIYHRVKTKLTK